MSGLEEFPPPTAREDDDPDGATPFEDVEIGDDEPPPQDEALPDDEKSAIAQERGDITASNHDRAADQQISVDPLEVN
jgi:hypothetical protein